MSVQRCKAETTATEFQTWLIWRSKQWDKHEKLDFYLSQIAQAIWETAAHKRLPPETFLLKFRKPSKLQPKRKARRIRREMRVKKEKASISKAMWIGWAMGNASTKRCPQKSNAS